MEILKKAQERNTELDKKTVQDVAEIIQAVRAKGDEALWEYSEKFDESSRRNDGLGFRVTQAEIDEAYNHVERDLIKDMAQAAMNILGFAEAQKMSLQEVRDFSPKEGIFLGHRILPIDSCLCYVPGGNYPLYSTALMLIIPAKEAGVKRVVACAPVAKGTNHIDPKTLVAMDIAGADEIYAIGGTQAIAAFSYGTESIKPVDLIVGPGNKYVAEAKRQCYGQVGIDFVAGPSEVLVISDGSGSPEIAAADLLAQAEHDINAKSVLITTNRNFAIEVIHSVEKELSMLDTAEIATQSWNNNGEVILVDSMDEAVAYSNQMAPEHLEINVDFSTQRDQVGIGDNGIIPDLPPREALEYFLKNLTNYGSLFIGQNTAEVFGDYASGPNHTLPTVRASRYTGGLWVGTFLKTCTYQYMTDSASAELAPIVERLATGEGLSAHAYAAKLRSLIK